MRLCTQITFASRGGVKTPSTREIYDDSSDAVIDYALVERERVITLSQMRLCTLSCQEGVLTPSTRPFYEVNELYGMCSVAKQAHKGHLEALYEPQMMSVWSSQGEVKKVPQNANFLFHVLAAWINERYDF